MINRYSPFAAALVLASGFAWAQPTSDWPDVLPPATGPFAGVNAPAQTSTLANKPALGPRKTTDIEVGRYRFSGTCEKMWIWGQKEAPVCEKFAGMIVMEPGKPQFFFPFKSKEQLWVFVTKGEVRREGNRVTYQIEKVYNKGIGAEFAFDAGECSIDIGPKFECKVWQDTNRSVPAYDVRYQGNGNWQRAPLPTK